MSASHDCEINDAEIKLLCLYHTFIVYIFNGAQVGVDFMFVF